MPSLQEWSAEMVRYSGCYPDVIFFTDGKPLKMARLGRGETVETLVQAAGDDDVNLAQQGYYSMCCRLILFVTHLLALCAIMMPWFYKSLAC
jgi:hypothetical protein